MIRRQLPIGIQDFRTMREQGCYYVDKTSHIQRLITQGRYYFLSRPRRFGKSLLIDTLQELFEGNESLFRNLDIHEHWDWSVKHPVVRLSFDGKYDNPDAIDGDIVDQLDIAERQSGLEPTQSSAPAPRRLRMLLDRLHRATGQQAVVLVDEYDKPILDVIDRPEIAKANRDYLRGFYGIIKGSARDVRFVFVTGISMFSKVSLFSGLNNLINISLNPNYATICGYTDRDLDTVFAPELSGLDRDEIRKWYNGYHWLGDEKLYNPFDLLLLFNSRNFEAHWFETGSPTFLFQMLMERETSPLELENLTTGATGLSKFDVDDITIDALLFQTGYLTITEKEWDGAQTFYTLDYPNFEVRQSLNQGLLGYLGRQGKEVSDSGKELSRLLVANDFDLFTDRLKSFFAGIPYQWHSSGDIARYEAWYAGMLYACFCTIGLHLRVEDSSSRGRADMVVLHGGQVFVFEFKMANGEGDSDSSAQQAIEQIQQKGYADKYRDRGEPIHLIGVAFSPEERNLVAVKVVLA